MLVPILLILFFVAALGFLTAAECALIQSRSSQLEEKMQSERSTARLAIKIIENIDKYLVAIRIWCIVALIFIVLYALKAYSFIPSGEGKFNFAGYIILFLIITVLISIFGISMPKSFAARNPETTACITAYPVRFIYLIVSPLVWFINSVSIIFLKLFRTEIFSEQETYTQEELKYLIEQASEQVADNKGDTEEGNAKLTIIKNAFEFSERSVRQIMVPRTRMTAIDLNDYHSKTIEHVIEEGFSRIPCYADSVDNIVGMVHLKDILKELRSTTADIDLKQILRPVSFVPESKRIVLLLSDFQKQHQQMAMVVNEYGGIEGLITMEDILEELVGEIQDESDNETPFVQQVKEKTYHILAAAAISDINHELPHPIDRDKQYDTLAGYLIDKFGKIPLLKEKLIDDDYEFTILKKAKTSIVLVEARDLIQENLQKQEDEQTATVRYSKQQN
ncbi:MAG: hemolysin family protein [Prevotellaceae bacterium]|jgi:CBS domain containing-hemolysin-like protein|nr:hemolysin family protein [Prevotellaceae bacterium]